MKYRKIKKGEYELSEDYSYYNPEFPETYAVLGLVSVSSRTMLVRKGYKWDGPSGLLTIPTKNSIRASLIHDVSYSLISENIYPKSFRKQADKILRSVLRLDGMSWFRSEAWYFAVRLFGWRHIQ